MKLDIDKIKNDGEQELQYSIGKLIAWTVLVVELINLIPGVLFGNLWCCPWIYLSAAYPILSRIKPILGVAFAFALKKGYSFSRYALAILYAHNVLLIGLNIGEYVMSLQALQGISIFFAITHFAGFVYNFIICVELLSSKGLGKYLYVTFYGK